MCYILINQCINCSQMISHKIVTCATSAPTSICMKTDAYNSITAPSIPIVYKDEKLCLDITMIMNTMMVKNVCINCSSNESRMTVDNNSMRMR